MLFCSGVLLPPVQCTLITILGDWLAEYVSASILVPFFYLKKLCSDTPDMGDFRLSTQLLRTVMDKAEKKKNEN